MDTHLMKLQTTAIRFSIAARKFAKKEKKSLMLAKRCVARSDRDGARVHSEDHVRYRNMASDYTRMAARIESVASLIERARMMGSATKDIRSLVAGLDRASRLIDVDATVDIFGSLDAKIGELEMCGSLIESSMMTRVSVSDEAQEVLVSLTGTDDQEATVDETEARLGRLKLAAELGKGAE